MSVSQNFPTIVPSLSLDFARVKKLDPRISFSRASSAVSYDGKTVAKAEENLFQYSQEFDNAYWAKSAATVTANAATAPDGTTTADKVIPSTDATWHRFNSSVSFPTGAYFVSFFCKPDGYKKVAIRENAIAGSYASFDAEAGTVLATGNISPITVSNAAISVLSDGWVRISAFFTAASGTPSFGCYVLDDSYTTGNPVVNYAGDGTSGMLFWGAQAEQRSSVTAYTPTTTQPITNYIPVLQTASANTARFDHDPVTGESLGLLVEEQRTNLLTYSEQFDNAAWVKSNVTVTANQVIAPDGTLSMDKLVLNSGSTNGSVRQSATGAPAFTNNSARINLSTKEVTVITGFASGVKVEDIGNEVLRISATVSEGYTGSVYAKKGEWEFLQLQIFNVATVGNLYIYPVQSVAGSTGDGYSGIFIWGAQLEASTKATSYIKTEASQVTRSADSASDTTIDDWFNPAEGTLYASVSAISPETRRLMFLTDGTTSNRLGLLFNTGLSGQLLVVASGATQASQSDSGTELTETTAICGSYQVNNFALSVNGSAAVTDTSGIVPSALNRLDIGSQLGSDNINGHLKKIAYYPKALTATELAALTS